MKMKIASCALWANLGIAFAKRLSQPNATLHGQVLDARRSDIFFNDATSTDGGNSVGNKSIKTDIGDDETSDVTIVIMSDRLHGLIPALGSIVTNSKRPVDILLIGKAEANLEAKQHFGDRVANFITMTLEDVEDDLVQNGGQKPIWTWDDWHASYRDDWQNKNTMHLAEWDGLETHSYTLNHMRFYLPYLSVLQNRDHVFLIDDDVLVQKDISDVIQQVIPTLDDSTALTCPCNIWGWNDECHHFDFFSKKSNIMETSVLYAGTPSCETTSDPKDACLPANWEHFLEEATPTNVVPESQTAWNFGFCLMHNGNWRENNVTEKYEHAMRKNYESHAVPENSLAFGLGLPFISLAGNVACWNEDIMKIRDGFGFIEWSRYQSTFGKDFFSDIDVAHYTGPKKPWVEYSTIETNSINPWLDMMRHENITIPPQLSTNQTTPLFAVLTGHRSGSEWVTNMLDLHPHICSAGETHKPENGFPTEAMFPRDWEDPLPKCSVKVGCTYNFALTEIQSMIQNAKLDSNERAGGNTTQPLPSRCLPGYRNHSDTLLAEHRQRLCNMIIRLDGNYTDQAILKLWVEAFQTENDAYTGCSCPRGTRMKGLKLMVGWLENPKFSEFHETAFADSKIIRFKRANLWQRFHSLFKAEHTGLWHARGKDTSKEVHETWDVNVNKMISSMKQMHRFDLIGDEWAKEFASDVLWVDYDECRQDHDQCRDNMLRFLGVDPSLHPNKKEISKFASAEDPLALIKNKAEVREALGAHDLGHYIGFDDYKPIQVLTYETDSNNTRSAGKVEHLEATPGINVTVFGHDSEWKGFGSKYRSVPSILDGMDEDSLVVLSDARDVIFNIHKSTSFSWQHKDLYKALVRFRADVEDILRVNPGAVIISAEAQCCVSAMSHAQPGDLFALDGSRALSACPSGSPGCKWQGDNGKVQKWHRFMKELAAKRGATDSEEIYLNAGLIAGRAGDLKKHIANLQIKETEDDQAVWTDYMYRNPESVVLDYSQRLFGSNQWKRGAEGCVFDYLERKDGEAIHGQRLYHKKTHTNPLFIHSPGNSDKCHDSMFEKLEKYGFFTSEDIVAAEKRVLEEIGGFGTRRSLQNYGDTVTVSLSLPVCNACGTAVAALESDENVVDEFKKIACEDGGDCQVTFTGGECGGACGGDRMLTTQGRSLQVLDNVKETIVVKIEGSLEDVRAEDEVEVAIQTNKQDLEESIEQSFVASGVEATADLEEITIIITESPTSSPTTAPTTAPTTGPCQSWCYTNKKPWSTKCTWKKTCKGCDPCNTESPTTAPTSSPTTAPTTAPTSSPTSAPTSSPTSSPTTGPCQSWCYTNKQPWSTKCTWKKTCKGCDPCNEP